jgi:hypothetical protein
MIPAAMVARVRPGTRHVKDDDLKLTSMPKYWAFK